MFYFYKYVLSIIILSTLCSILITACTVATGSSNLEDEVYLNLIVGRYKLNQRGVTLLNTADNYFPTIPSPLYSTDNLFYVDHLGTLDINTDTSRVILKFVYALDHHVTSAVFQISAPDIEDSGALIKKNRYLKITLNNQTNLIFSSQYANSSILAEQLTADLLFANPI